MQYQQEKAVFLDACGARTLIEADRPKHPLGKAIASTALLAYVMIAKYCDGLPLYRLEGILKRYGADITRTTLANWLIRLSLERQPLVNLLQETQLKADFTPKHINDYCGIDLHTKTQYLYISQCVRRDRTA